MDPRPKNQISFLQNGNWCAKENQLSMTLPSEGILDRKMLPHLAICGPDKALWFFFSLVINSNTVTSIIGSVKYPLQFIFLHHFNKVRFKQKKQGQNKWNKTDCVLTKL